MESAPAAAATPPQPSRASPGAAGREADVIAAFVDVSGAPLSESGTAGMLARLVTRCVALLGVDAAGIVLPDRAGTLLAVAASGAGHDRLQALQLRTTQGPCLDCVRTAGPVAVPDLARASATGQWPRWAPAALQDGVRSVYALPMHLDDRRVGALGLSGHRTDLLTDGNRALGRALAEVATTAVRAGRTRLDGDRSAAQLQGALDSRIVIEQAKGVIGVALGLSMDDAFAVLRTHARATRRRLADVAGELTTGRLGSDELHR